MSLKIVMMATGEFALPSLKAIVESAHDVVALITQPDRVNPRGVAHPHPVKDYALSQGLKVLQPHSINTADAIAELAALNADVVMVAAYGQILSAEVIRVPPLGMYNLHASLLPRHRGAAPIQYAIWKGDQITGVTIFRIEPKLDAGPMIVKHETTIQPDETSGQLHDRLAVVGAEAMLEALDLIEQKIAKPLPQNGDLVTQSPKIRKEQGEIHWQQSAREIDCHIRAMQPWPNPFTWLHRSDKPAERLLILQIAPNHDYSSIHSVPGTVIYCSSNQLVIQTGKGAVSILQVQRAGKKPMQIEDFLRGTSVEKGDWLGPEAGKPETLPQ